MSNVVKNNRMALCYCVSSTYMVTTTELRRGIIGEICLNQQPSGATLTDAEQFNPDEFRVS